MATITLKNKHDDVCLYECPASFYVETARKWVYGKFYVSPDGIYFECNEDQKGESGFSAISIDYNEISLIQKEASSYIFPSLTILVEAQKYWFGSFPSRESAYSMIEHFWKERLLLPVGNKTTGNISYVNVESQTELGRQLLNIAHDSEKTLNDTARNLHRQGRQLQDALMTMENVHSDLGVADQQLSHLESWFGKLGSAATPKSGEQQQGVLSCDWNDYRVVYQRYDTSSVAKTMQQPGTLRISKDGIALITTKDQLVHFFKKVDVSAITVLSPWEMKLEQRQLGQRDICFTVTTAQLLTALSILQRQYAKLVTFEDPSSTKPRKRRPRTAKPLGGELLVDPSLEDVTAASSNQSQASLRTETVTDAEAQELYQMIDTMKALALGINQEQDEQLQNIDKLLTSVDNADITIQEDVKRIRRLM